jgi:hypothetical protein
MRGIRSWGRYKRHKVRILLQAIRIWGLALLKYMVVFSTALCIVFTNTLSCLQGGKYTARGVTEKQENKCHQNSLLACHLLSSFCIRVFESSIPLAAVSILGLSDVVNTLFCLCWPLFFSFLTDFIQFGRWINHRNSLNSM